MGDFPAKESSWKFLPILKSIKVFYTETYYYSWARHGQFSVRTSRSIHISICQQHVHEAAQGLNTKSVCSVGVQGINGAHNSILSEVGKDHRDWRVPEGSCYSVGQCTFISAPAQHCTLWCHRKNTHAHCAAWKIQETYLSQVFINAGYIIQITTKNSALSLNLNLTDTVNVIQMSSTWCL